MSRKKPSPSRERSIVLAGREGLGASLNFVSRCRFTSENVFLLSALAVVAVLMVGQLWGTGFTCDDDLYTATAWQRTGANAYGWVAIWRASRDIAVYTGRFYQLFAYTLTQIPYHLGSFETVNVFRIGGMLFAFATYAAMLASLTRSFPLAMYCSILCAGLMETRYDYNPFHAFPLWFNVGIGILFVAILLFHEGLVRGRHSWIYGAAVSYFAAMLFYELFLLYGITFFILAYIHNRAELRTRVVATLRALMNIRPLIACAVSYLLLYAGFRHRHSGAYAGTAMSLGSFRADTRTIVGFSMSGLNFHEILPTIRHWNVASLLMALLVLAASFLTMLRLSKEEAPKHLLAIAGLAAICMFLPNILYGFTERYREWLLHNGNFYLGSFYSAFAEAVVIGALSLWLVRQAFRVRLAAIAAAVIAMFLAVATYSNVHQTMAVYQVHRETRKIWDLVDSSISGTGRLNRASILVAPGLMHMNLINPAIYDYWSFYFSARFRRPIRVIGTPAEYRLLPGERQTPSVYALVCRYFPNLQAGFFAFGPLDVTDWLKEGRLIAAPVEAGVLGKVRGVAMVESRVGTHAGASHAAASRFAIENQSVDLSTLVLRR